MVLSGLFREASAQSMFSPEATRIKTGSTSTQRALSDSTLWLSTSNPSSLGLFDVPEAGYAAFGGDYLSGSYKRSMDEGSRYSYGFNSDSYRSLKDLNLYGSFSYSQQYLKDKAWSENYDPYGGNPYVAGSSLPGNYVRQIFGFNASGSSRLLFNRIWCGLAVDYKVGDSSRSNDPRSRVQLADYDIRPGIFVRLSDVSRLGINGVYRFRKEKMLKPVTKADNIERYTYYCQKGMSEYSESGLLFFTRRYVGNYYGGDVQYIMTDPSSTIAIDAGAVYRDEIVEGLNREIPGAYSSTKIHAKAECQFIGSSLRHNLALSGSYSMGSAEEYLQQQVTETNEQGIVDSYWKTMMKNVCYKDSGMEASALWKMSKVVAGQRIWYLGVKSEFLMSGSRYLVPESSMTFAYLEPRLLAGCSLFHKGARELNVDAHLGWHLPVGGDYSPDATIKPKKTMIKDNVNDPDWEVLGLNAAVVGCSIDYSFARLGNSTLYFSAWSDQYHSLGGGSRMFSGITLGLLMK